MRGVITSRCITAVIFGMICLLAVGCAMDGAQRRPYLVRENLDNAKRHLG